MSRTLLSCQDTGLCCWAKYKWIYSAKLQIQHKGTRGGICVTSFTYCGSWKAVFSRLCFDCFLLWWYLNLINGPFFCKNYSVTVTDYSATDKDWKNIFRFQQIQTDRCEDTMMTCADAPYLTTQRVVKNNPCNSVFSVLQVFWHITIKHSRL